MRIAWPIVLAFCVLLPAATVAAPLSVLPGFKRTVYTAEQGAPPNVTAIAQSRDGYLWVGTNVGLYRFDGRVFERIRRFERKGGAGVGSLWPTASGDLWIGYGYEGVALLRQGRLVNLPEHGPAQWTADFSETPDGAIYILNGQRLFRFYQGAWTSRALPEVGNLRLVLGDRQGRVWVMAEQALLRIDPGTLEPTSVSGQVAINAGMAQDGSGRVWVADLDGLRPVEQVAANRFRIGPSQLSLPASLHQPRLSRDRAGHLWIAGTSRALLRLELAGARGTPGAQPIFETPSGSPAFNTATFEDREGNLWVGNALGIERYSRTKLLHHSAIDPELAAAQASGLESYQVLADGRGTIYVRIDFNLYRIGADGLAVRLPFRSGLTRHDRVCPATEGGLWVRTSGRFLEHLDGPSVRRIALPEGPAGPPRHVSTCIEDGSGNLWAGLGSVGFVRLSGGPSQVFQIDEQLNSTPFAVGRDWEGHVLAYRGAGRLSRQMPGGFSTVIARESNPIGFIGSIYAQGRAVLLGGEIGFGRYDGRRLDVIPVDEIEALQDASGIVQTRAGETWMLTHAGILRMRSADLEARLDGRARVLPYQLLNHEDGLTGTTQVAGWSNVAQAADGRIWFATTAGIFSLDPRQMVQNHVPPPVFVQSLVADGRGYDVADGLRLPQGTHDLQINFTALSLSVPARVQFRYRLVGNDADWVDPGTRRQAVYTNLKPGKYRFEVIAANNDGVWNRDSATLDFVIPPTFIQSGAFLALLAALLVLVAWVAYTLHVRGVAMRLRARLEDRLRERERIARELHDTLLQSVQGLIFQFQGVADRLPKNAKSQRDMVAALDQADAVLREGRDRVVDLRGLDNATDPLRGLADAVERHLAPVGIQSEVLIEGKARPLVAGVAEELARLAEEALMNVSRHAGATRVDIVLGYGARELSLSITDDGVGMDEDVARHGRLDHFGLTGMRERAERLGGRLKVHSRPGAGTSIWVTVPRRAAYCNDAPFAWFGRAAQPGAASS